MNVPIEIIEIEAKQETKIIDYQNRINNRRDEDSVFIRIPEYGRYKQHWPKDWSFTPDSIKC